MDTYKQFFRSYPVSELAASAEKRHAANFGGKVYMPPSALSKLTTLRISYPMLFEVRSGGSGGAAQRLTHAGVMEFIAPEGRVYLPEWMMARLALRAGSLVELRSTSLELGSFVRLEPQSADFLEISDPKAVLENSLRNFSALTEGDVFRISYNSAVYEIKVLDVQPETDRRAICVVETDLSVDFAPPVGYDPDAGIKKPRLGERAPAAAPPSESSRAYQELVAAGSQRPGIRLSGREAPLDVAPVDAAIYAARDAPALVLPEGQLFFGFPVVPVDEQPGQADNSLFKGGQALRQKS